MENSFLLEWAGNLAYPFYETVTDWEAFRSAWLYNVILMRITDKLPEDEVRSLRIQNELVNIDKAFIIARVLMLLTPFKQQDISRVEAEKLENFLQVLYEYNKMVKGFASDENTLAAAEEIRKRNEEKIKLSLEEPRPGHQQSESSNKRKCSIL